MKKIQGSKFKVQSSRFEVQGSRFKVQGSQVIRLRRITIEFFEGLTIDH
jgi:hypothetical protein